MGAQLDALVAQVAANTTVEEKAATLIEGLADRILGCDGDPDKLTELANGLKASADRLAAVVAAQEPASPA